MQANPKLSIPQLRQLMWYVLESERLGEYYGVEKNFKRRRNEIKNWIRWYLNGN